MLPFADSGPSTHIQANRCGSALQALGSPMPTWKLVVDGRPSGRKKQDGPT